MNNNGSSRFFEGLVLGLIIGGIAVYLVGTKGGKRILKKISEEGFSGLEELLENYNNEDEEVDINSDNSPEKDLEKPVIIAEKPKKRLFRRFRRVD